jgi:SAM-dependent methyltransferase
VRLLRRRPKRDYKAAVGGHWDDVGRLQFEWLVARGLRPDHRLLDMPCGSFRAGRFLIEYLDPGRYVGVEGDADLLRVAKKEVLGKPLLKRAPELVARRMPAELPEADLGWVHALFDHIPPEDVCETIVHLGRAVPRFFGTFFVTETPDEPKLWLRNGSEENSITTYADREYWHHSPGFIEQAAARASLEITARHEDYDHPLGLTIVEFARPGAPAI